LEFKCLNVFLKRVFYAIKPLKIDFELVFIIISVIVSNNACSCHTQI